MMKILDGRTSFYQWDTNQQVVCDSFEVGGEVHFYNLKQPKALIVSAYELNGVIVANVPNILLQSSYPITVYKMYVDSFGRHTRKEYTFKVHQRPRPTDYVYTEVEIFNYKDLSLRIEELEKNGVSSEQISTAVEKYLDENPIESGISPEEVQQINTNKENIEKLNSNKLDTSKLPEAINEALVQAKASGEFNGNDYVLTEADKQEIAEMAAEKVDVPEGEGVELDTTLTQSGKAADSKAVGDRFGELSEQIDDIGRINTVTGTSATITDAIAGKVISCEGESAVTVKGYNICPVKELSGVGFISVPFGTTLPAGKYTLTADIWTNNPDIDHIEVAIGGFHRDLKCNKLRSSETFNITREINATIGFWVSDSPTITEYSATLSNIVITADSTARDYEPYFEPVTYDADNLNEIKLTEYTNLITSDSEFTLRYVCKNAYVESLFSSIDIGAKKYVEPEDFGAFGDGLADDTRAVNECIEYAIANSMPIRGYGKYKTTDTINIIGDCVDLNIYQIDYLGTDDAVVYQGSNSFITIHRINSKGNGLYVKAETANVHYNTFTVNEIISEKNGVHLYAIKNNYQNKLHFNYIQSKGEYSCVLFEQGENPDKGYLNEWQINGGLVTGGLWGIRGYLSISDSIHIHAENLGSEGRGGAIYSDNGSLPRIYYCRNAEVTQINSFLKLSGVFAKPQTVEISKTVVPLESIDITELELDIDIELESDNIQALTEIEVQEKGLSNILLTKHLIFWGNRFQFPPVRYIRFDVVEDIDMTPQYYHEAIPQCFVAKADATINLHPTYAANCLSTFEVVQEEGHKLTIKDFVGNVIFDGTQYEDGRYRLTAYVAMNRALKYDMSNQLWEIIEM